MKRKNNTIALLSCVGIVLLILDSKTAVSGAVDGISLCIKVLIPSLFPFLVLSSLLAQSLDGRNFRLMKHIGKFCGIPTGAEHIFLISLIGGYPIGAKIIADHYKSGNLSQKDAQHMLGFCNNAGPAFLFGVVGPLFSSLHIPWLIWLIHISSAILTGHFLMNHPDSLSPKRDNSTISPVKLIESSTKTIAIISAWVVIFRVLLFILKKWLFPLLPLTVQVILTGCLELTNGCIGLGAIENTYLRFAICAGMLSFGGICVIMQTSSVTSATGLGKYFPGKILQTVLSVLLSFGIQLLPLVTMALVPGCLFIHKQISRKNSRFSAANAV